MADKVESEKSKIPPTRPPRRARGSPTRPARGSRASDTQPPCRPPPPSNLSLLSVPLTVALVPTPSLPPTILWPPSQFETRHVKYNDMTNNPWGMTPISEVTNGTYSEFKKNEQIVGQKNIPLAQISPTPQTPPSPDPSSRSSNSPFQSPTPAQGEVLRFIFSADPFAEITLQDVIDNMDNPFGLDVAPDFDLPENFDDFL